MHSTTSLDLPEQMTDDQISGDDEENVYADVPAAQPLRPEVVKHDDRHSDRAQCLDVRSQGGARLRARCHRSRFVNASDTLHELSASDRTARAGTPA